MIGVGKNIEYQVIEGHKYRVDKDAEFNTGIRDCTFAHKYFWMNKAGVLTILSGYLWDGPSGISFDTKNFMRGSLLHDALYQAIREGHLDVSLKKKADELLRDQCREDNMSKIRSWYVYKAVRKFGRKSVQRDGGVSGKHKTAP